MSYTTYGYDRGAKYYTRHSVIGQVNITETVFTDEALGEQQVNHISVNHSVDVFSNEIMYNA